MKAVLAPHYRTLVLAGALIVSAGTAWGQAWKPEKPVEIVTSSAAGGSNDRVARMLQKIMQDDLPVIYLIEIGYTHIWNKRVKGLITNGISMYSNWDSVWLE